MMKGLKGGGNAHVPPRIVACDVSAFSNSNVKSRIWREGTS